MSHAVSHYNTLQHTTTHPAQLGYAFTDLVKNQLDDTAQIRGMTKEQVITDVLLRDQPTKRFVEPDDIGALVAHLCGCVWVCRGGGGCGYARMWGSRDGCMC